MGTRVYIGNLPLDVRESEIEDVFARYGRPRTIDIKGGREGAARFAFVEYDDPRDARDAVEYENGREFLGARMRVEIARGGRDRFDDFRGRDRYSDDYRSRGRYDDRYDDRRRVGLGPSPYGPSRKTEFAVEVSGLDPSMSWQDLKDHFRTHKLEVTHADVDRRGRGVAMFSTREDMEDAVKLVDGTEMRNMRGACNITVEADRGGPPGRSRSRTPDYRDDRGRD